MTEVARLVYLAGPVRSVGRDKAIEIRKPLERFFVRRGFATFSPPGAWCGDFSDASEEAIKRGNDAILASSNLLAVTYMPGVVSVGTDAEVVLAAKLGIPIMVVSRHRDDVSHAIAWASPLIGEANISYRTSVEFVITHGSSMDTVTVISYDPHKEGAVG